MKSKFYKVVAVRMLDLEILKVGFMEQIKGAF